MAQASSDQAGTGGVENCLLCNQPGRSRFLVINVTSESNFLHLVRDHRLDNRKLTPTTLEVLCHNALFYGHLFKNELYNFLLTAPPVDNPKWPWKSWRNAYVDLTLPVDHYRSLATGCDTYCIHGNRDIMLLQGFLTNPREDKCRRFSKSAASTGPYDICWTPYMNMKRVMVPLIDLTEAFEAMPSLVEEGRSTVDHKDALLLMGNLMSPHSRVEECLILVGVEPWGAAWHRSGYFVRDGEPDDLDYMEPSPKLKYNPKCAGVTWHLLTSVIHPTAFNEFSDWCSAVNQAARFAERWNDTGLLPKLRLVQWKHDIHNIKRPMWIEAPLHFK
ncbi:uncharacterized protein JN550_001868 [Neoarthrinium moseri]|uniref:uncharacterized protein n=1 Tax=Neoarthrinium moseri TaxID=1658444 RepID=UPI001FDAFAAE|nr:uncharacterized protein JN550_001868 [Neoarthrinium moseri]KAI1875582.1 hypothetical protein JN550_001868 [Neoarthrinium moseri]